MVPIFSVEPYFFEFRIARERLPLRCITSLKENALLYGAVGALGLIGEDTLFAYGLLLYCGTETT